ncbi:hypothetical protein AVEN_183061-1 [Araneus ventricosus]|uniref:Uncharacterized protein n=1 Tax=Araneus ventricosus TaxID=182803 RepID=A0A4Y2X4G0_ARAVE|nr:hypothetical protein AVEN_139027-1 [Araneus ventricosus]GBO42892.1 hypothetical protein AVEN_183061-1 [Araneus ventricosus]
MPFHVRPKNEEMSKNGRKVQSHCLGTQLESLEWSDLGKNVHRTSSAKRLNGCSIVAEGVLSGADRDPLTRKGPFTRPEIDSQG